MNTTPVPNSIDQRHQAQYGNNSALRNDEVSLNDLWNIVYRHRKMVISCAIVGLLIGAILSLMASPQYSASAVIAYDPDKSGGSFSLDDLGSQLPGGSDTKAKVETEVKILASESLGMDVINKLRLDDNINFFNKSSNGTVGSPRYRGELARAWSRAIAVRSITKTNLIEIKVRTGDPELAAKIVNTLVDAYIERNFRVKYQSASQASEWLKDQLADIKARTESSEQALAEYEKKSGIILVSGAVDADDSNKTKDSGRSIVLSQLAAADEAYSAAKVLRIEREVVYRASLTDSPEILADVVPGSTLPAMRAQQADLRNQYALGMSKYGPEFPKVKQLAAQLDQMNASIVEEVSRTRDRLTDQFLVAKRSEDAIGAQVEGLTTKAYKLNDSAIELQLLEHEARGNRELYDGLLKKLNEAGVIASLKSTNITIVDKARVPGESSSLGRRMKAALGLFVGLFIGIAGSFALNSLSDTIGSAEEVEAISGAFLLAAIPTMSGSSNRRRRARPDKLAISGTAEKAHVVQEYPKSQLAEAFRVLRTALLLSRPGSCPKTIVITSGIPTEGKSTISMNLALVLAQRNAKVLLIDADMRKGTLHLAAGVSQMPGLSAVLSGVESLQIAITTLPALSNLSFLPSGFRPPNPAELLDADAMSQLLRDVSKAYDFVVIDTPPVLVVTDAVILAGRVDATIIVSRSELTKTRALQRTYDLLRASSARIVGSVLNAVDLNAPGSYASGYYHKGSSYYDSYGEDDNATK